ncbi:MAG TPA: enoyl-CoA hydratase-related protein [Candidatus Polarisedimenticolia bacterium]|nr:enoyl-CoA hydratase-related protein [Candidatus Polarisedimenticolia bacterium]
MSPPKLAHAAFDFPEPGLAVLTIDRPPVNALGRDLVADLEAACGWLESEPPVSAPRALVVAAKGKVFCAGADLKERQSMTVEDVRAWVPRLSGLFTRIASLPMPTIAVVHGVAAGGGMELALACDLRVAEEQASLGLRETALAILPGAGGTQRLPRLIGPSRAKRWIFTAALHSAAEALIDGAVDAVAPSLEGLALALKWGRAVAANGPVAVRLAKRAVDGGLGLPMPEALEHERRCYEGVLGTEDRLEALAAFREKRDPRFVGR